MKGMGKSEEACPREEKQEIRRIFSSLDKFLSNKSQKLYFDLKRCIEMYYLYRDYQASINNFSFVNRVKTLKVRKFKVAYTPSQPPRRPFSQSKPNLHFTTCSSHTSTHPHMTFV